MLHLYDALVGLAVWLLLVPLELAPAAFGRSSLGRLASRLGRPPRLRERGRRLVVLHAVSVGEMAAAGARARHWAARHPADRLVLCAGHRDGLAAGERLAAELSAVVAVVPLPWDRARAHLELSRVAGAQGDASGAGAQAVAAFEAALTAASQSVSSECRNPHRRRWARQPPREMRD